MNVRLLLGPAALMFYLSAGLAVAQQAETAGAVNAMPVTIANGTPASSPQQPLPSNDSAAAAAPIASLVPPLEPAKAASLPAPMTRPALVPVTALNAGDTAWMLVATVLVLLMTIPGLALFYTGMVRKKNALSTMSHSFATVCIATLVWVVAGYSIAFMPGSPYLGSLDRVMLEGMGYFKIAGTVTVHHLAPAIPESVFMMFQMTFAIITPALIAGAFAERMKFSAYLLFVALWSLLVYAPVAHWVWEPGGWLAASGVLDFAGGTVVHISAGIAGLVAAIMIGPRKGFGKEAMPPHNLLLTVVGASMLWVGWFGFNAGSALAADSRAGMAMMATQVATAISALTWTMAEMIRRGKPSVLGMVTGAVSGLVAITPASGFVGLTGALAIGAVAGVVCYWGATTLKSMLGYDDSLDVFGVHALAGITGALLTGVFVQPEIGGVDGNVATQALGVLVTVLYVGGVTLLILFFLKKTVGLRTSEKAENAGLDVPLHGEHVL